MYCFNRLIACFKSNTWVVFHSNLLSSVAHEENVRHKEYLHILNRYTPHVNVRTQIGLTMGTPTSPALEEIF
jgi:hypothetical protein